MEPEKVEFESPEDEADFNSSFEAMSWFEEERTGFTDFRYGGTYDEWALRGTWSPAEAAYLLTGLHPSTVIPDGNKGSIAARGVRLWADLARSFPEMRTDRSPLDWLNWATAIFEKSQRIGWAINGVCEPLYQAVLAINSEVDAVADVDAADPSELPSELDCANQVYRAVQQGFGDPNQTFKNRVRAIIAERYPWFGPEAQERIATVSNANKSPGRPRRA